MDRAMERGRVQSDCITPRFLLLLQLKPSLFFSLLSGDEDERLTRKSRDPIFPRAGLQETSSGIKTSAVFLNI